ncbi:MAG: winged helix-turn-helix transcriptional regulator [Chitinophagaceae bacterium]|nr:winged helix-turn-helix transcriptional regulator [Chitinophagaceae bacterium]
MHDQKNLNATVIFHIIGFSDIIRKYGDTLTQQHSITTQQWWILLLLATDPNFIYLQQHRHKEPMLAMELADALNVSRANITNLLNVLIIKKLIIQVADKEDRRRKRLILTTIGEKLLTTLEKPRFESNQRLLKNFTKEEKENVVHFIKGSLAMLGRNN